MSKENHPLNVCVSFAFTWQLKFSECPDDSEFECVSWPYYRKYVVKSD